MIKIKQGHQRDMSWPYLRASGVEFKLPTSPSGIQTFSGKKVRAWIKKVNRYLSKKRYQEAVDSGRFNPQPDDAEHPRRVTMRHEIEQSMRQAAGVGRRNQ